MAYRRVGRPLREDFHRTLIGNGVRIETLPYPDDTPFRDTDMAARLSYGSLLSSFEKFIN